MHNITYYQLQQYSGIEKNSTGKENYNNGYIYNVMEKSTTLGLYRNDMQIIMRILCEHGKINSARLAFATSCVLLRPCSMIIILLYENNMIIVTIVATDTTEKGE